MIKAIVTYKADSKIWTIPFEAADLDTIKVAVNQWRVKELILKKRWIEIVSIVP